MIIEQKAIEIKESSSKLKTYCKEPNSTFSSILLAFEDKPIFTVGITCPTCAFFFNQLSTEIKSITIESLRNELNDGLKCLDENQMNTLAEIYPNGNYDVWLSEIKPKMVRFGDEKDYFRNEQAPLWFADIVEKEVPESSPLGNVYYRGLDQQIDAESKVYEFFVPLYQPESLDENRVQYYQQKIREGHKPTALALGILSINEKMLWDDEIPDDGITTHWTLAHYLLDGHHKIQAAYREQKPITLISFIQKSYNTEIHDNLIKHYS